MLSQLSVIPEAVFSVTAATRGRKLQFENAYGRFIYRRLPERAWFGYTSREVQGYRILQADCEKALLDAIYWSGSKWDNMRFQQERVDADRLDARRLRRYAEKWGAPKLKQSVEQFKVYKEAACLTW